MLCKKVTVHGHDAWPIPSIEENLEKLQGASYFTAIDASTAYHTYYRNEQKIQTVFSILATLGHISVK